MDSSFFLTIVAAATCFLWVFQKFRFNKENRETPSSLLTSPPPSSLSTSSVPPPSSSPNWGYDVFPSFCGEDVRKDFLSHIQKEFQRKGITPFNDNGIERGESIGPELKRAIKGSKIAIILLSRNYASSKWCLEELVETMKCREEFGQTVMPIFYKVDPSDVKKLTGDFGKVFKKTCVGKRKEDTEKWRHALEKVATIAGYHSRTWNNEAAMMEKIATDVSNKLISYVPSSDFDSLVGMRAHMESMELLLRLDSDEVRMIGIWGPPGIGKSTIARSLFSQHSHDFQLTVYMENIKIHYPKPCFDRYSAQLHLQKEFLSRIINHEEGVSICHLGVVENRLKDKKVLVVLDDVDQLAQLDALAKVTSWFGPGSRIIVITQDKKILNAHGINRIYKVDFPDFREALEIFCMHAFGQKSPYDGFQKLAREVTYLAGYLPLGLRVMGCYLKGMHKKEWEEELPRLRTRLDGEIESILKFSYDALCDEDKDLFLHIACFFKYEEIYRLEEYLAENFVGLRGRLRVLAEKSFIYIDSGYVRMHYLLERFGMEIVRKQSPNQAGQRQFLVDEGDIFQVLRNDSLASQSVIGINFTNLDLGKELKISDRAFERMSSVQFLRIDCVYHPNPIVIESLNSLPHELRVLHWRKFPKICMPSNFNPEFLVELNMRESNLEKLWEGNKPIRNIKWMNLSESRNLKNLPDFSTATNLRILSICNCSSLVELPSSIGNLHKLRTLLMRGCSKLKSLPININMKSLVFINLADCSSLKSCPEISTNIEYLSLKGTAIEEIPPSIRSWSRFDSLDISYSENLRKSQHAFNFIRELHVRDTGIQEIAPWVKEMSCLEALVIKGCTKLVSLPELPDSLLFLDADDCSSLERLHCSFNNTKFIEISCANCFKLNQEARDLIIKASTERAAVLPGETVPTYFTYRAAGSSLSMNWNGLDTQCSTSLRFKACLLLVGKQADSLSGTDISYCIKDKLSGVNVKSGDCILWYANSSHLKEHLLVAEFEITVNSPELGLEFEFIDKKCEIKECGLRMET